MEEGRKEPKKSSGMIVALVVIIAILGGTLAWVFFNDQAQLSYYQSQINELNSKLSQDQSQINSLNSQINNYKAQVSKYQNEIKSYQSQINSLNAQINSYKAQIMDDQGKINDLRDIVNLNKGEILIFDKTVNQPAGGNTTWSFSDNIIRYAGYLVITIEGSTTPNTYVKVIVDSSYTSYTFRENIGTSGTCYIPVLPGTVTVIVGNTNWFQGATITVTVEYYY